MKKLLLPFSSLALLLLIGAGCQKTAAVNPQDAQLAKITLDQQAYVYCTNRGFVAKVQFDSETNKNRVYCTGTPGQQCDAIAFMNAKCDPKKINTDDTNKSLSPIEDTKLNCDHIAKPVCGTDGKTYVNACTAKLQGKKVRYEGICNEKDEPFELTPSPELNKTVRYRAAPSPTNAYSSGKTYTPGESSNSPTPAATTQPTNSKTTAQQTKPVTIYTAPTTESRQASEWVPNLTAVLESSTSGTNVTLSECMVGSEKYYYQKEDCSSCFKVLYRENGETACYPGLDDGQCPAWSEKNCKVVWSK
jgi:putative hemolysin